MGAEKKGRSKAYVAPGPCPYCGAECEVEIADVTPEYREFTLSFCCEASERDWQEELAWLEPRAWKHLFAHEVGLRIRQVAPGGDGGLYLDWGLDVRPVSRRDARAFVKAYHRHNAPCQGDIYRLSIWNGSDMIGVVTVGRPVARENDQRKVLEVTRLCVRDDLPIPGLKWNAASQLYGEAAREAARRSAERIITYTLQEESGISLISAGWQPLYETSARPHGWDTPARPRQAGNTPNGVKVCWEKRLKKWLGDLNRTARAWRLAGRRPIFGAAAISGQLPLFEHGVKRSGHGYFNPLADCPHCVAYAPGTALCVGCRRPLCAHCIHRAETNSFHCNVGHVDDESLTLMAHRIIARRRREMLLANSTGALPYSEKQCGLQALEASI